MADFSGAALPMEGAIKRTIIKLFTAMDYYPPL
ncbi:MAG: hypothetical protein ACJAQT_000546 [Akkermansiaceae bacterium]|jgi:hypothetical protein